MKVNLPIEEIKNNYKENSLKDNVLIGSMVILAVMKTECTNGNQWIPFTKEIFKVNTYETEVWEYLKIAVLELAKKGIVEIKQYNSIFYVRLLINM